MGTIHARNLTALGLGEVVTFADAAPEKATALQAAVGTGSVSTDIRRAIEDPRIQAVVIATHHDSHPDYAVMAANAGKHILIEKPLALTVTAGAADFRGRRSQRRAADGRLSGPLCPAGHAGESLHPAIAGVHRADD